MCCSAHHQGRVAKSVGCVLGVTQTTLHHCDSAVEKLWNMTCTDDDLTDFEP